MAIERCDAVTLTQPTGNTTITAGTPLTLTMQATDDVSVCAYNPNGHLSTMSYPDGASVAYAPNALGQPSQAGSYASGIKYHPNGAIKEFTYGNLIKHTMTQNVRQLPRQSYSSGPGGVVLNDEYAYDRNGNVVDITDMSGISPIGVTSRHMKGTGQVYLFRFDE